MKHIVFICILIIIILFSLYYNSFFNNIVNEDNNEINIKNNYQTNNSKNQTQSQTALITGGARGIGKAYATILLENNYKVVILDKLNAIKTANELKGKYGNNNVLGIHCDITDFSAYNKAFEEANRFSNNGIIDILILNAAIIEPLFHNSEELIKTNLTSPIYSIELYVKKITNNLSKPADKPYQIIVTGSLASFKPIDLALSPVYLEYFNSFGH